MRRSLLASCAVAAAVLATARGAAAETLAEALADAYNNNPQLLAERALLRATDENVPQALSGWRPTVQFTGSAGFEHQENRPAAPPSFPAEVALRPNTLDLNVTQPVFNGGRTVALTAQAEKTVEAERARHIAVEETVFLSVAQAYLDVVRDQATLDLAINNEQVLRRQLEATNDQFRVGAVTRTDVAQAEARLAGATASRQLAEGNLQVSRANYARAVGHVPSKLEQPSLRPTLPTTRDEAIALASAKNPNVIAALFTEDAARDTVDATRDQLLPSLSLVGDALRTGDQTVKGRDLTAYSIIARVAVPLYEGGSVYSQTRQAAETVGQRRSLTDDARRAAIQGSTQAWEQVTSGRAQVVSLQSTIRAAEIALEGVRQEATVGSRTVLDVLNAEQELFTDRVQLVTAQHDLALAEFSLSNQIGRLTAADLKLPVTLYDVDKHYRSVRDKWIGFGSKQ
jgi:outer membrane protein